MKNEVWKRVEDYADYEVSSLGRIRRVGLSLKNKTKPGMLNPALHQSGYLVVKMYRDNKPKQFYVQRLIAEAFLGMRPWSYEVNHIDGIKTNNAAENLEYLTSAGNTQHAHRLGLANNGSGFTARNSKLNSSDIEKIKIRLGNGESYGKICKDFSVSKQTICNLKKGRTYK